MKRQSLLAATIAMATIVAGLAHAEPIKTARTIYGVDVATAGIGGINTGTGTITLSGVSGKVKKAYLYWHGFNSNGLYTKPGITMNGSPVTGVSTGTSGTNCWGSGQSQGYEADVTALVSGDGTYALTGLGGTAGDNVNGASLVVLYNDAISTNNRGVVFYTGNDSTHDASHLGDPDGWQASLPGVNFSATGDVKAILHVADGQAASDGNVTFSTTDGSVTIADTPLLFEGVSLPSGGVKRGGNGLYDVHTFDITPAFGSQSAVKTLNVNANPGGDCLALVAMQLSFNPPTMAPDVGTGGPGPAPFTTCKAAGITNTAKLSMCQMVCERKQTSSTLAMLIRAYLLTWKEDPPCGTI